MTELTFKIIYDWEGGIHSGSLCFINNKYLVRFSDGTRKTFSLENCQSLEDAKKQATEFRDLNSIDKGLTVNMFRLIECDIEGTYYEVKLNKNLITKIDVSDLHLIKLNKWSVDAKSNYVRSSDSKKVYHRLLFPEIKYICHLNGDNLDNRKHNLAKKQTHVISHSAIKKQHTSEWLGGVPSGSVGFINNAYIVRFNDGTRKTFSLFNCENLKDAKEKADEFQVNQSLEKGLTKNQYRYVQSKIDKTYIEMKLQDEYVAKFDVDDLYHAQTFTWCAKKQYDRYYMYQSSRANDSSNKSFHRILFPEYTQVDHINRDGLDNRRKNLRPVSIAENNLNQHKRKDNQSGKTGIHYSNYDKCWVCQWPEDGKRKKKSFSESKYGYDGAKLMAINHRQKMDIKNDLMNGYGSDGETNVEIEPISIEKVKIKENLLSTNKSGKKGVYYMENYKFWAVEWKDEDGKKKCNRFYVGKKRTYDEAKDCAMKFKHTS